MYHFSNLEGTLNYGDGRKIVVGQTLTVYGPVKLCSYGLHASPSVLDALKYAPGTRLWGVELGSDAIHDPDKSVSTSRTAVRDYGDVLPLVVEFSQWCAARAARAAAAYAADARAAAAYAAYAADAAAYAANARAAANAANAAANAAARAAHYAAERAEQNRWWKQKLQTIKE